MGRRRFPRSPQNHPRLVRCPNHGGTHGGEEEGGEKTARKKAAKRELIKPKGDCRYVRRGKGGKFKESDDVGWSQAADRSTKAKKVAKSGQGDRVTGRRSANAN